jgi:hypothetical protein
MATYRALAEAESYERRRLVTAFMTGSPHDTPVERPRDLRSVVGGLLVTALCTGAVTTVHRLTGHPDARWDGTGVHVVAMRAR